MLDGEISLGRMSARSRLMWHEDVGCWLLQMAYWVEEAIGRSSSLSEAES